MDESEELEQVEAANFRIAEPLADEGRVEQDMRGLGGPGKGLAPRRLARLAARVDNPDAGMGCVQRRKGQRSGHRRNHWYLKNKRATSFGRRNPSNRRIGQQGLAL